MCEMGVHVMETACKLLAVLLVTICLTGCGDESGGKGGKTTCAEWWALALPMKEQMFGNPEQDSVAKKMVKEMGYPGTESNIVAATLNIDQFCGYDWSQNTRNANRPIEDAMHNP